jgi:hypothetical protein
MTFELLDPRSKDGTIDVSQFALRMGIVFPVHIDKEVYKRHCAAALNPDRDVFIMLSAAVDAIDDVLQSESATASVDLPFHYRHKPKGFRETDVRLYASLEVDDEDLPWILLHSTKYAPSVPEASAD